MGDLLRDFLKELFGKLPKYVVVAVLLSGVAVYAIYKFYEGKDATFGETVRSRSFLLGALLSLLVIWTATGLVGLWSYLTRPRPPKELLQVAVASFYGNSDLANDEGRGLRTLIRQELNRRTTKGVPIRLIGEIDAPTVYDFSGAIKYGRPLSAHLVGGGEITALGKEVKFLPLISVVFPFGPKDNEPPAPDTISLEIDAPNHMQLAEATARNVADLISGVSGLAFFHRNEFDKAIQSLNSITVKTPDVWTYLANAYLDTEPPRREEAQFAARQAIAADSKAGAALNMLGAILISSAFQGEDTLDQAQSYLERAAEIPDSSAAATSNLGIIASLRGDNDRASQLARKAIQLEPSRVTLLTNLAAHLIGAGRMPDAEIVARGAVERDPNLPVARNLLGMALFGQKRFKEAVEQYGKAIELNNHYAVAFNNLGEAAFYDGRPLESISAFERAIELNPAYQHAYNNMGYVLHELGRLPEAETSYKKAIDLDPKYADPWSNLVRLYGETKRTSELTAAVSKYDALKHLKSKTGTYSVAIKSRLGTK